MGECLAVIDGPEALGLIANFKQAVPGIVALAAIRAGKVTAQTAAAAVVVLGYPKSCTATAGDHKNARLVFVVCGRWIIGGYSRSGRAHRFRTYRTCMPLDLRPPSAELWFTQSLRAEHGRDPEK